jgi:radical SAM superfamily enzyme with C-terminal helix-hairpin-helix motif
MSELFSGRQVEELIKLLRTAARELQTLHTDPIIASVDGDHQGDNARFIHTIVPISDASGETVSRLFLYSERVE